MAEGIEGQSNVPSPPTQPVEVPTPPEQPPTQPVKPTLAGHSSSPGTKYHDAHAEDGQEVKFCKLNEAPSFDRPGGVVTGYYAEIAGLVIPMWEQRSLQGCARIQTSTRTDHWIGTKRWLRFVNSIGITPRFVNGLGIIPRVVDKIGHVGVEIVYKESEIPAGSQNTPQHRDQESTYLVIGLFSPITNIPRECLITVKNPAHLFRSMRSAVVRIRGLRSIFSLKEVRGFTIYKCHPSAPKHERVKLDPTSEQALAQLFYAYSSWRHPADVSEAWTNWIQGSLNSSSTDPVAEGELLSLEIILDWSVWRISVVILMPVLLSLAVGLGLNSKDWTDAVTIQTAWLVATYVTTTGALLGALLAIISGISLK